MTAGRKVLSTMKEWCTPPGIVASVERVLGEVYLDPCSNAHSLVPARVKYQLPDSDGLVETWDFPTIYVNPPYGRDAIRKTTIYGWFAKIGKAAARDAQVMALVPVATNTKHWKDFVYPLATGVCFLSATRLKFWINGAEDPKGAPMSCAMIYYGDDLAAFQAEFRQHGAVMLPDSLT